MTLGGSSRHLISLYWRLKLKRISQALRLTQVVRELKFILFHSWFSVHAAILDVSQRCKEHPPLDYSSLRLCLFRWKRRWNNLGWVSCLLSGAHKLCGYWSPATIPQVCINRLKGWSPYLLSEHLLGSDLVSLTPSTVFGIQRVMDKCVWDKLNEWDGMGILTREDAYNGEGHHKSGLVCYWKGFPTGRKALFLCPRQEPCLLPLLILLFSHIFLTSGS